jgi:hypothetical protein
MQIVFLNITRRNLCITRLVWQWTVSLSGTARLLGDVEYVSSNKPSNTYHGFVPNDWAGVSAVTKVTSVRLTAGGCNTHLEIPGRLVNGRAYYCTIEPAVKSVPAVNSPLKNPA